MVLWRSGRDWQFHDLESNRKQPEYQPAIVLQAENPCCKHSSVSRLHRWEACLRALEITPVSATVNSIKVSSKLLVEAFRNRGDLI